MCSTLLIFVFVNFISKLMDILYNFFNVVNIYFIQNLRENCVQFSQRTFHNTQYIFTIWLLLKLITVFPASEYFMGVFICSIIAQYRINQFAQNLECLCLETRKRFQKVKIPKVFSFQVPGSVVR